MLQNIKAKFKVSGVVQGPQGTPAEKTVKSITMMDFLHHLQTKFREEFPPSSRCNRCKNLSHPGQRALQ